MRQGLERLVEEKNVVVAWGSGILACGPWGEKVGTGIEAGKFKVGVLMRGKGD